MSAWDEMRERGGSELTRREDKCLTLDEIENMLRSMNISDYTPIHKFKVVVKEFTSNNCEIYSIAARANEQKNFYSQEVLTSFKILMEKIGDIIEIDNLFV
jgi:hypothetical protein